MSCVKPQVLAKVGGFLHFLFCKFCFILFIVAADVFKDLANDFFVGGFPFVTSVFTLDILETAQKYFLSNLEFLLCRSID